MKRILPYLLAALFTCLSTARSAPSEADWKKVDDFIGKQLPRSALEALTSIESAALAEKAWPDAVKAQATRISIEAELESDRPEIKLILMDKALAKAPPEIQPVLETIAAEWFYNYFQNDSWTIRNRTAGAAGPDIATWDLKRLVAEIDARFQKALTHAPELKRIPIGGWQALLTEGELPDSYQPTLYDFLAQEALAFYKAAEQTAIHEGDVFESGDDSPILGSMEEFLAWNPGDGEQPEKRAIRLSQELMRFHVRDADPGALVLLDIQRLEWGIETAAGPNGKKRAVKQLAALVEKHARHEVSLRARHTLARFLIHGKKPAEARMKLLEGLADFENSVFAPACRNEIRAIEKKELSVGTELVWNEAGPEISLGSRNVKSVFFKAFLLSERPEPELAMKDEEKPEGIIKRIQGSNPARSWKVDVPQEKEYMHSRQRVPAPADLKPGLYLLCASGNQSFSEENNALTAARVWVTPLALVERERQTQDIRTHDGWVLDAVTGDPVSGARVTAWQSEKESGKAKLAESATTGPDGFFSFQIQTRGRLFLFAEHGGFTAMSGSNYSYGREERRGDVHDFTALFTDRAIYRPGQTIRFKGIHYHINDTNNHYRVLPKVERRVSFRDVSKREIDAQEIVTSAYGSISGSFTAPLGGLTGTFEITDGAGSARFSVEEYKRPKFKVEIDPPAVSPKLNERAVVKVKALAYTGAAVDGATVKWAVGRQTQYPPWANEWGQSPDFDTAEIAHGEATTRADGTVEVAFTVLPDKSVDDKLEAYFYYRVHVDVTDPAGETRSADRTLSAGTSTMLAELASKAWQTTQVPVQISVKTTSLEDEPEAAEGTLTVFKLVQPEKVHRPSLRGQRTGAGDSDFESPESAVPEKDLSSLESWETGEVTHRSGVKTDAKGVAELQVKLGAGAYRAVLETHDRFGTKVTAQDTITVIDPGSPAYPIRAPFWVCAPAWTLAPGTEFEAVWGTGYDKGRACVELEHRGRIIQRFWTDPARTQQRIKFPITEEHRGGLTLHITQMKENRLSTDSSQIEVPWTNKELKLKWEHLTSKLQPGAKDTWTAVVTGPNGQPAPAEMTAVLYDASLEALSPHNWDESLYGFYHNTAWASPRYQGSADELQLTALVNRWDRDYEQSSARGRMFPWNSGRDTGGEAGIFSITPAMRHSGTYFATGFDPPQIPQTFGGGGSILFGSGVAFPVTPTTPGGFSDAFALEKKNTLPDLNKVSARRNMQETAFFFPNLEAGKDGVVKMSFTMPEAVTTWRFMGFAHDKELRSGLLQGETVTARDLMVQPNPPRFLRENDTVEFTVKVTNQSDTPQNVTARLNFADAVTQAPVDLALGITKPEQSLAIPAKESRTALWRITVPDGQGFLKWKAVAGNDSLTDGEEGWLPVLPRRIPVTESLPLALREAGEKKVVFKRLADSAASPGLQHRSLTLQMVSQPAWYAVMALPYLMEYPHECSEQTFNRLYANALGRHIAKDGKVWHVFDLWRNAQPAAMRSPLEKNADLKSLLLEETPWLQESKAESQRSMGILFDDNRLDSEVERLLARLAELQLPNGAWPWFPGGPASDFITLYIVAGFGRLDHLGVELKTKVPVKALDPLDAWVEGEYKDIVKRKAKDADNFNSTLALYLYARSFFLKAKPVEGEHKKAVDYFLGQAAKHWTGLSRMSQAHAALGLLRFGDKKTPPEILASLKERSTNKEEIGACWPDESARWSWNQAPVETQALMMEAFREIGKDDKMVNDCKVWLLKQKQTQSWPTTKATADAVYALLLGGTNDLVSDALVSVSLGGKEVKREKTEAGTGFYEKRFDPAEINAAMGAVKLVKKDKGAAWGSLNWQYLEDVSKVTPHEGTPLSVTKAVFTKTNSPSGPQRHPVTGKVHVGDELVVRLEIRADRDMEFVHLKDQRPSSVEPVNVLSGYKWQGGLGYYESTRDSASHFFFDSLLKGTYVFEYSVRVQLRGKCQSGIAELQCMYAPEFNSHSASAALEVE